MTEIFTILIIPDNIALYPETWQFIDLRFKQNKLLMRKVFSDEHLRRIGFSNLLLHRLQILPKNISHFFQGSFSFGSGRRQIVFFTKQIESRFVKNQLF